MLTTVLRSHNVLLSASLSILMKRQGIIDTLFTVTAVRTPCLLSINTNFTR